ncbi:hypothetical protein V144x_39470 [Gimesia aquarii]|uniref:Uncharacterized protein n=1 Tax=Gimesia aquarii TaxID=2527964 RepID=A0A517VZL8_9PLAN|nr:hypothetical protein V144x_39470 [Gimesia aquarii]
MQTGYIQILKFKYHTNVKRAKYAISKIFSPTYNESKVDFSYHLE